MNTDILHVLDKNFPPDPRVEGEIQALKNHGFKVDLITLSRDIEIGFFHSKYLCPVQKVRVSRITYKLSALAYTIPLYHLLVTREIYRCVKRTNPKIIHVHDIRVARSVKWISKISDIPYVLDLHENRPEIMKEYAFVKSKIGRLLISLKNWRKNEKTLIQAALRTIVVTSTAAEYYVKRDNSKPESFCITTNTTSEDFNNAFIKPVSQNEPYEIRLLYIGDTSERRGILDVLKAMDAAHNKRIRFDILGSSSFDDSIHEYIKQKRLQERVKMHGWVGQREIHEALSKADFGISPLIRNEHHDTTIANKLSQYSLYSLPIIVSDCIAQKSMIEKYNCGYNYKAGNISSLVSLLESIRMTLKDIPKLKSNSRRMYDKEFTNSVVYSDLVAFYSEALENIRTAS